MARSKPSAERAKRDRNMFERVDDFAMDRMPDDFKRMHHAEREVIKPDTSLVRRKPTATPKRKAY